MALENRIDEEVERFARLRGQLEKVAPMIDIEADNVAWLYGDKDDEGWRDDDVDPREQIDDVRATLLELVDSTYRLEGLLDTQSTLMS
jgi:hypothetical protein